jgi:Sulfotransferase family
MTTGKPKLVSLLSNWYSGATLFTILLDGHSRIVSNGESMFFDDQDERRYDCSCGKYIDECDFYRATTEHMRPPGAAGWDKRLFVQVPRFSRNRIVRSFLGSWRYESALRERVINAVPGYRGTRDRFLEAQLRFFANARERADAPIYMDGTKSMRRAQLFARDGRCDMKVLHLIRDGRGFCASYLKNEAPQIATAANAVKTWLRHISQVDGFSSTFPSVPVLSVRYEDLCRSTEETIRAVCQFLEIPYEDVRAQSMNDTHILGNEMRKSFDGTIVESTSWREKLDLGTQARVTSLMRPQLERFGYV